MIAGGCERIGQIRKDTASIVLDLRGLAVQQARRGHNPAAKYFADALMSETNTEHWQLRSKAPHDVVAQAGLRRPSRSWRNANMCRSQRRNLIERNRIVAFNHQRATKLAKVLGKIVSKRVVVIDDQDHVFEMAAEPC